MGVALPLLLLGEVSANDRRERARQKEIESAAAAAQRAAEVVADRATVLQSQLLRIGEDIDLQLALGERDASRLNALLLAFERIVRADFALGTFAVAGADGRVLAAPRPPVSSTNVGDDLSGRSYFQEAARTRRPRAALSADDPSARVVIFAAPVARLDKLLGVLVAELRLRAIADWMRPHSQPGEDVYVIDGRGVLLARAAASGEALVDLSTAPAVARALLEQRFIERVADPRGQPHLLASARVPELDWTVMVVRPADAFEPDLGATLDELRALRLLLVAVSLLGAYGVARLRDGRSRRT